MTWLIALSGFFGLGLVAFGIWWLVQQGKAIARGQEAEKREIALEKQGKATNHYLEQIDQITKEENSRRKEIRDAFRRGSIRDLVRTLDTMRKGEKADKE